MSGLETLIPTGAEVVIAGEALTIRPLKVGQLPAFLRTIAPVMRQITGARSTGWPSSVNAAMTCCQPLPSRSASRGPGSMS